MQNSDQSYKVFEEVVQRILDRKLSESIRNTQNVFAIGTVVAIDYSSQTVDVRIVGGGESAKLQYPKNYASTEIGIGSKVVIASLDNFSGGGKYIVAAYGGF